MRASACRRAEPRRENTVDDGHQSAQIYLIADAGPNLAERLTAALDAVPVATVLLEPAPGQAFDAPSLKPHVEAIQARGIAALVAGDAGLARTLRADGVHLAAGADIAARLAEARDVLGTRYIVGVGAGPSRHDAMELGEAGVDYVAFGSGNTADDATLDMLDWWSEIFEVPCVGFAAGSPDEARALAEAGADFIACRLPRATTAAEVRDAMTAIDAALDLSASAA